MTATGNRQTQVKTGGPTSKGNEKCISDNYGRQLQHSTRYTVKKLWKIRNEMKEMRSVVLTVTGNRERTPTEALCRIRFFNSLNAYTRESLTRTETLTSVFISLTGV